MPAPTNKRVAVPFLFRAADGLGANGKLIARSYGATVEGVVTRAGKATFTGTDGSVGYAPHSTPRLSVEDGEHALLVEPQLNNIALYSEDFSNWSSGGATVTTNATRAPDGSLTADLLDDAGNPANYRRVSPAFAAGTATRSLSVFLKQGTSTKNTIGLQDVTGNLRTMSVTWTDGVPALSVALTGSGGVMQEAFVQDAGNGWYRLAIIVPAVNATNEQQFRIYPGNDFGGSVTGTVYAWGAQAEDLVVPTSYYPTTASLGTRIVDRVYFPFTLPPQAMTVYCRYIHRGALRANLDDTALSISDAALNTPRFALGDGISPWTGTWQAALANGSTVTSSTGAAKAFGDVVEMRGVVGATGTVLAGESINGAAETTGSTSAAAASGLPTAWSGTRIYLGSPGTSATTAPFGFTHVCVALGTKTMAEMRLLAEVG